MSSWWVARAPPLAMSVASALFGDTRVIGGVGVLLVPAGLAVLVAAGDAVALRRQQLLRTVWSGIILMPVAFVVVAGLVQPWANASDVKTLFPASDMGAFFAESFFPMFLDAGKSPQGRKE